MNYNMLSTMNSPKSRINVLFHELTKWERGEGMGAERQGRGKVHEEVGVGEVQGGREGKGKMASEAERERGK
jgi:hypothetical protein